MNRLKPIKGSGAKQKGKRGRINANKVKGPINLGGANVGKKGVVGTVGGKDVVNRKPKKKKPIKALPAPRPEQPRKLPKGSGKRSDLKLSPAPMKARKKAPAKKRPRKKV